MSKTVSLALTACLALTGCQMFRKSPTWTKVVHTRIAVPAEGDISKAYAAGLHRELKADRIAHQVVTYQYRYRSRLRDDATAERTAVIYRDDTNPAYPFWLKDETSNRPVWLPNGSAEQQIRFYVGREVQVLDPDPSHGDGKEMSAPHVHGKKHAASKKKNAKKKKKK